MNRKQFIIKVSNFFLGLLVFINFPFANYFNNKIKEGLNMFRVSPLPKTGPWITFDPFLFCVHHKDDYPKANDNMGPDESLSGRDLGNDFSNVNGWSMYHGENVPGFPRHPHRGFETITIVDKGLIDHSDSLGYSARYGDGDVQWLTAGDGIQHSEMFPLLNKKNNNPIDFFQIWINLKSDKKRVAPNFSMFWKKEVPKIIDYDENELKIEIDVIAGEYKNEMAPAPPPNSWANDRRNYVNIWKIKMDKDSKWKLPLVDEDVTRTLYFYSGKEILIDEQLVKINNMIEINDSKEHLLSSKGETNYILLLQAKPISEPVVKHGPFVMNTRREIQEAFKDYNRTGFGQWEWDNDGPVHGSKYEKFAIGDNE
tara:strand:- start:260 stop:1366 length:1107 start_codon:yes stop_codon:yes gene_type:complete